MTANPDTAKPTEFIDNANVRVTQWDFPPGAETGWHRHDFNYVVVPLTTGTLKIVNGEGEEHLAELTKGIPYYRDLGVEHNVINANDFDFAFIEVECKPAP